MNNLGKLSKLSNRSNMKDMIDEKNNQIYGLVWGIAIADALGKSYEGHATYNNIYDITPYDIDFKHDKNDWTDDTDMTILLMDNLVENELSINIPELALSFKYWQKNGFKELGDTFAYGIGSQINFIITQTNFVDFPIQSSRKSYKMMGRDSAENGAIMRNAICGTTKFWYQNTIKHCLMTHYDTRCIATCLVQSYLIRSIWLKKKINWDYIHDICESVINDGYKKSRNLIEFNKFWHLGLNYQNLLKKYDQTKDDHNCKQSCFLTFIKQLNVGNYELFEYQNYTLIPMVLCVAIIIDINYLIDKFNKNPEEYNNKNPIDVWYYMGRIKDIISVGGEACTNASTIGSIIGIYIGYANLPEEWVEKTEHRTWMNTKIINYNKKLFSGLLDYMNIKNS